MALGLGRKKEEEIEENVSQISARLKGQCGLLFTNEPQQKVLEWVLCVEFVVSVSNKSNAPWYFSSSIRYFNISKYSIFTWPLFKCCWYLWVENNAGFSTLMKTLITPEVVLLPMKLSSSLLDHSQIFLTRWSPNWDSSVYLPPSKEGLSPCYRTTQFARKETPLHRNKREYWYVDLDFLIGSLFEKNRNTTAVLLRVMG